MRSHSENLIAWVQRLHQYRQARENRGYKHPAIAKLHEALACSGLPSAERGLADAEDLLVQEAVADFLNPSSRVPGIPPVPVGEKVLIIGHDTATNAPIWIRIPQLCLGSVLVGAPGSGKTHLLASIVRGVDEPVRIHAPDAKKEFYRIFRETGRRFLYAKPSQLYTNILECPIQDALAFYTGFMEYLGRLLGIDETTYPEIAAILTQIRLTLPKDKPMPSLVEFIALLRKTGTLTKKSKYHTAATKFLVLAVGYGEIAQVKRGPDLHSRYSAIGMDYSGVAHSIRHATEFLASYRFIQIQSETGHETGKLRLLIPADEGLDIWGRMYATPEGSGRLSFQDTLAAQGRSYGVGRIVTLQFIRQGMDAAFCNSGIIIVMRLPDPSEARLATRYLNIPEEMAPVIQNLQEREAFVKTPSYPTVRMRALENTLDSYASASEINAAMEPEIKWMRENSIISPLSLTNGPSEIDYTDLLNNSSDKAIEVSPGPEKPTTCQPPAPARQLLAEWRFFLREVIEHPDVGICAHYRALNLSGSRGVRTKTELIDASLLVEKTLSSKTGRPITKLIVTDLGLRSLEAINRHET